MCRHASRASFDLVDGYGEWSAEQRGVVLYLVWQVEFDATADGDRCAEYATCVFQHEVHHFWSDFLCCTDEVALVLAVFIIYNDDEFAFAEVVNGFLYGIYFEFLHI